MAVHRAAEKRGEVPSAAPGAGVSPGPFGSSTPSPPGDDLPGAPGMSGAAGGGSGPSISPADVRSEVLARNLPPPPPPPAAQIPLHPPLVLRPEGRAIDGGGNPPA